MEEGNEDEGEDFSFQYQCPSYHVPLGRDSVSLSKSGGGLRWHALATPSDTWLGVRWYSGRLFATLSPGVCPPLDYFVHCDKNYSHRRGELVKRGFYCEATKTHAAGSNGRHTFCVLEWDALIFLLEIRNAQLACRCCPKETYDAAELWQWQHFARQVPYGCTPEALGYAAEAANQVTTATTKGNELGQNNRKARNAGRKKMSSQARLEQVARSVLRNSKTEAQNILKLTELFTECQKEGITYALDDWARQLADPDRRLPLHLLTGITNQSAKRIGRLQSQKSATEAKQEKQQRAQRKRSLIPKRFRKQVDEHGVEHDVEEQIEQLVVDVAEQIWAEDSNLTSHYRTARMACQNEFALSKECRDYWVRVWEALTSKLPRGVLGITKPESEREVLRAIFESACNGEFEKLNRRDHYAMRVKHPDGWSCCVPNLMDDYTVEKREKDLRTRLVGELHIDADHNPDNPHASQPIAAFEHSDENPIKYNTDLRKRMAPGTTLTDVNTLATTLTIGNCGALALGAERKLVVERRAPKTSDECGSDESGSDDDDEPTTVSIERWMRIADTTTLVVQWATQNADAFLGSGNVSLTVALELWIDGTTIGGRPSVASYIKLRPIGNALVGDGPDAADQLMDASKRNAYLKDRLLLLCDDTRETREVYETIIRLICAQLRNTVNSSLPIRLPTRRVITLDLQVEPIRGE